MGLQTDLFIYLFTLKAKEKFSFPSFPHDS